MTFREIKPRNSAILFIVYVISGIALIILAWHTRSVLPLAAALAAMGLLGIGMWIHMCLICRIIIGHHGIEYRAIKAQHTIPWNKVENVHIARFPRRVGPLWICFVTKDFSGSRYGAASDSFIRVQHSKNIEDEVRKYWNFKEKKPI